MSLKSFHIVFITFILLMSVFFAAWGFSLSPEKNTMTTVIAWCGVVGIIITPIYGIYFWRKIRHLPSF